MTLPIQLVVSASILLSPPLLGTDPFGRGLLIGSSINNRTAPNELFAIYRSPEAVKADYGVETPEYRIAQRYFAQIPRPKSLMIATVTGETGGGDVVTLDTYTAAGSGDPIFYYGPIVDTEATETGDLLLAFKINGGATQTITIAREGSSLGHVLEGVGSTSDVLDVLNATLSLDHNIAFSQELLIGSVPTEGEYNLKLTRSDDAVSTVQFVSASASADDLDVSTVLGLTGQTFTFGDMTPLSKIETVWDATQSFYGIAFTEEVPAAQMQAVVDWCQSHYRLPFFVMTASAEAIATVDAINTLGYYTHVTTYYHDHDEVGAIMGMALDQKFDQPNGIKTLKFKTLVGTEPTVIGETLAGQLDAAGVNYYTSYGNPDAPVLMYSQGFAGAGKFADFVMGLHWLRNDAQVEVFNAFRINPKLDQTESGMSILKAAVARSCMRGGDNGLIAEGQWNGQPLGTVNTGDYLPTGYYIYADKIRNQTQQVRETRQAQPISALIKGAGALHGADIAFIGEQ